MATSPTASNPGPSTAKTVFTVVGLLFFPLVGVIFMWIWMLWPKWVKWLITVGETLLVVIMLPLMAIISLGVLSAINPKQQILRARCADTCQFAPDKSACANECVLNGGPLPTAAPTHPPAKSPVKK